MRIVSQDQTFVCLGQAIPLPRHQGTEDGGRASGRVELQISVDVFCWNKSGGVFVRSPIVGTHRLHMPFSIASLNWRSGRYHVSRISACIYNDISRQIRSSRVTAPSGADMQAEPKGRLAAVSTRALGVDPVRRRVSGRLIGRLNGYSKA